MQSTMSQRYEPFLRPDDVAGLVWWFDAAEGVKDSTGAACADGVNVATWEDQSANGRNLTQSTADNRPQYKEGGQNGNPYIFYDADWTDNGFDALSTSAHAWGGDSITLFAVIDYDNNSGALDVGLLYRGSHIVIAAQYLETVSYFYFANDDQTVEFPPFPFYFCVLSFWLSDTPSGVVLQYNGISQSSAQRFLVSDLSNGSASTQSYIGGTGDDALSGRIYEIFAYNTKLTAQEMKGINNYLNAKYGL